MSKLARKVAGIRKALHDEVGVLEGWGGLYLMELTDTGICGLMPGLGMADLLNRIFHWRRAGRTDVASALFGTILPHVFVAELGIVFVLRKTPPPGARLAFKFTLPHACLRRRLRRGALCQRTECRSAAGTRGMFQGCNRERDLRATLPDRKFGARRVLLAVLRSHTIMPMTDRASEQEELQSRLYASILAKIISGEFPPGKRLVEEELARATNVSRTPVREVLIALHRDGLLERVRNCGMRVASFTADDVDEIFEIRKSLECLAVPSAVRALKLNELLDLECRLESLNRRSGAKVNAQQAQVDLELHRLITNSSGNRRLITYLENLSLLIHSLRLMAYRSDERARQAGEEHLGIVRALLRRDVEMARRLLAEHIETGKREVLELFFETYNRDHHLARVQSR